MKILLFTIAVNTIVQTAVLALLRYQTRKDIDRVLERHERMLKGI